MRAFWRCRCWCGYLVVGGESERARYQFPLVRPKMYVFRTVQNDQETLKPGNRGVGGVAAPVCLPRAFTEMAPAHDVLSFPLFPPLPRCPNRADSQ